MLDKQNVFEIHRLKNMGMSKREIARRLKVDRKTVSQYMENPYLKSRKRNRTPGKLDPYRDFIKELITEFPGVKAPVVLRQIQKKGFDGEITILRAYLRKVRRKSFYREPFIRFESEPGQQMQVDWGHFNSLEYGKIKRKLYALVVIESHSRMLYVKFTHSQKQEVLHQGLFDAFIYFGGSPKDLVVDNMMTAVTERAGPIIRFNDAFLDFMMKFNINPIACNIRAPHEKGKVEAGVKYLRNNFFPANRFTGLEDVQNKAIVWLNTVANIRKHNTTGEKPLERLQKEALTPLPDVIPDLRETGFYLVHKDFGIRFDGNVYTVPPWATGKKVVLKADNRTVTIYYKEKKITVHQRCWQRNHRIESASHKKEVKKINSKRYINRQTEVFLSLGSIAEEFLEKLSNNRQPIKKTIAALLELKSEYGKGSLLYAMEKTMELNLYGADYIENILYQEMTPKTKHSPVKFEKKALNEIILQTPSLKEYDAFALKRRRKNSEKNN